MSLFIYGLTFEAIQGALAVPWGDTIPQEEAVCELLWKVTVGNVGINFLLEKLPMSPLTHPLADLANRIVTCYNEYINSTANSGEC